MTRVLAGANTRVSETYRTLLCNTLDVGFNAVQINPGAGVESYTCIVQASHDNTGRVLVGNAQEQRFELAAGESVSLPVDIGDVWVRAAGNVQQTINWLAGG
jgi:hypothetical protein